METKINARWTGLTIARIASLIVAAISIFGFITGVGLLGIGNGFFSSSQEKFAKGDSSNVDALGGVISYGIGVVWLAVSVMVFCLALLTYFITTKRLKKRSSAVGQLAATEATQHLQTIEPQATVQASETVIKPKEDTKG